MEEKNLKSRYKAVKIDGIKHDEHRYVMGQHLGYTLPSDLVVHHKNENVKDNRIENLEVMTRAEHARLHQLGRVYPESVRKIWSEQRKGTPNLACRKLADEEVRYIRENYKPRDSEFGLRALSKKFNITHPTLSRIIHGERYKNIP